MNSGGRGVEFKSKNNKKHNNVIDYIGGKCVKLRQIKKQ